MGRAIAVKRWTPTALECYKRGCNCGGCFYSDFFSDKLFNELSFVIFSFIALN